MRFAIILIVGGSVTGALSVGAVHMMVQPNAQTVQAVHALGGDMGNFKITGIDPLKIFEDVKAQITSGKPAVPMNFGSGTPLSFPKVGDLSVSGKVHLDDAAMKRAMAAGLNSSIEQGIRRSQDMNAYGRNPMGWHGPPPF
jgi:hypothetical protein